MKNKNKTIIQILSRTDPDGYYVALAAKSPETLRLLNRVGTTELVIEEYGNVLIIRSRSRRKIERVVNSLLSRGLLITT